MKSAFTLIELLVVIVIIAVLAAILFPVFASAKVAAKSTQSMSNLKQLGLAWLMYADDHDDHLLYAMTVGPGSCSTWWWGVYDPSTQTLREEDGPLYPYTHSKGIQVDPTFPNRLRGLVGFTGYGYNYVYLGFTHSVAYGEIGDTVGTVAFGTSARINNWQYSTPTLEGNPYLDPPSEMFPGFQGRYNDAGNIVWCDGHVKSRKPLIPRTDFGFGFHASDFADKNLGDIDRDGNVATDELFDLN